jgi:hypothetical protein
VGGIKLAELGLLELEFLYRLDWRIVPNPEVLVDYYRGLVGRTEDYVLESDVSPGEEVVDVTEAKGKDEGAAHAGRIADMTETKWEEWMKDVADGPNSRKD